MNYHKKQARRNSTSTCMCKMHKKIGNSKHGIKAKYWNILEKIKQ